MISKCTGVYILRSVSRLQGYLSSLSMKAFSYINLDGIIAGK